MSVASAETASPTPFSATHSYGASSLPARTGSIRNIDIPLPSMTEYRLCVSAMGGSKLLIQMLLSDARKYHLILLLLGSALVARTVRRAKVKPKSWPATWNESREAECDGPFDQLMNL